jgi:SET domain-containing protein
MSDINEDDLYKDYDVSSLIKVYLDNSTHDDDTKKRIEEKLNTLHSLCAYNFNPDEE